MEFLYPVVVWGYQPCELATSLDELRDEITKDIPWRGENAQTSTNKIMNDA